MKLEDLFEAARPNVHDDITITVHDFDEDKSAHLTLDVEFEYDDGDVGFNDRKMPSGYVMRSMKAKNDVAVADLHIKKGQFVEFKDVDEYMEGKDFQKFKAWVEDYEG